MKFFSFLVVLATAWVAGAWCLMLLIGVVHAAWWPEVPTISYWGALQVNLVPILSAVIGVVLKSLAEAVTS